MHVRNLASASADGRHREVGKAVFLYAIQRPGDSGGDGGGCGGGCGGGDAGRGGGSLRRVLAFTQAPSAVQAHSGIQVPDRCVAANPFANVAKHAASQLIKVGLETDHFNNSVQSRDNIRTVAPSIKDSACRAILALQRFRYPARFQEASQLFSHVVARPGNGDAQLSIRSNLDTFQRAMLCRGSSRGYARRHCGRSRRCLR